MSSSDELSVELTAPNGRKYTQPTGLFINNEFVKSSSGEKITSINPTDETEITSVHAASAEDVDTAVAAARKAFKTWRDIVPTERGGLMLKLADLGIPPVSQYLDTNPYTFPLLFLPLKPPSTIDIRQSLNSISLPTVDKHAETLATIETWDNGKPYTVSLTEDVAEVAGTLRYYGGYADKLHGQVIDTGPAKFAYTIREPLGVCGQIIPWNYPLAMAAWKLGPALACGNTVVLKAAEQTPLSILYFATLVRDAGFPPGVVNLINGAGKVAGEALAGHTGVDKIAFTGSTATGRQIMRGAAVNLKNITLETGGKSPLLVFDDADLEQAAKWAHVGIMSNQGQICTATSRVLVQEGCYDRFVDLFKAAIKETSVVGDPFQEATFQGPQVTKAQFEKVLGYIESGKSEGATLAVGGNAYKNVAGGKGFFVEPTLFTGVTPSMKIYREEVFGPFVVVASFKTEEQAVEMANDTTYGLGSA
ncbi:MAG: hypothetical protein Q9193_007088, partial [Seirophora villosa]